MEYIVEAVNTLGEHFVLSDIVIDLKWRTEMFGQAGELEFSYIDQKGLNLKEGTAITFKVKDPQIGEKVIFFGMLITREWGQANSKSSNSINYMGQTRVTCYDLLWHLRRDCILKISKNEPYKPWEAFDYICRTFLKNNDLYRITDEAKAVNVQLDSEIQDKIKMSDAFTGICQKALIKSNGKDWLYFYDEGGKIVLDRVPTLAPGAKSLEEDAKFKDLLIIGDNSGLINFELQSSLAEAGYNRVNLYNNRTDGSRQDVVETNEASVKLFGEIPYSEQVDNGLSKEQLSQLAKNKLALFSMPKIELRIDCIGQLFSMNKVLRAGSVISIDSEYLKNNEAIDNNQLFVVDVIEHNFTHKNHMMSITLSSLLSDKFSIGRIKY